jgi:hypothetical protein
MALSMPTLVVGGVHFITEAAGKPCHGPGKSFRRTPDHGQSSVGAALILAAAYPGH